MKALGVLAATLALAACSPPQPAKAPAPPAALAAPAMPAPNPPPPLDPPAPGTPGGLPDDRAPLSEAPFTADSAQGAANVVQTYFALLEQGKYDQAQALWGDGGKASGLSPADFARSFDQYSEYHANIGGPGLIEGAAGSLYVEVPVQAYGRRKSGAEFSALGAATLRRVNAVPGSTPEQRRWHIAKIELKDNPAKP